MFFVIKRRIKAALDNENKLCYLKPKLYFKQFLIAVCIVYIEKHRKNVI